MKLPSLRLRRPGRRVAAGSHAVLFFALVTAAVLVAGSILGGMRAARIDLTEDDVHTLSPGSIALAGRLDAPATVTLYFSRDLPAPLQVVHRDLRDLLEEYRRASNGRLNIVDVDPDRDQGVQEEVRRLGIQKVPIQSATRDRTSLETRYLALGLTYRAQDALVLPLITNLSGFEYEFSSMLKHAMEPEGAVGRQVRFLSGHGELPAEETAALRRALQELKQLKVSDLVLDDIGVPEDTALVVLVSPSEELPEEARAALDAYLMGGGRILVFADAVRVDTNLQAEPVSGPLATFLAPYGVTLGTGIVGDSRSMGEMRYSNGLYLVQEPYPYFPRILQEGMSRSSAITRQLDAVTLRWPTRVDAIPTEGVQYDVLLRTSEQSFVTEPSPEAEPNLLPASVGGAFPQGAAGPQPLAVAIWGALPSAMTPGARATDARMVVIGDADVATNAVAPEGGNSGLLLNSVDWLLQDEELIQIRSKQLRTRPLEPMTPAQETRWRWGNLLIPPLLALIAGLVAWRLRRR